ncbi:hypothetical protein [Scytonema sp. UIC 10036]|uniref:hypothetical protein n=1 Tax=Scytonema sp. UIC 10036 TaxID=2304196 RepID=UPI001FAAF7CE|nr:hypothetical protein [Scytonema sp. UIC 10036]
MRSELVAVCATVCLTIALFAATPTPQVSENTKLARAKLFKRLDIGHSSCIATGDRLFNLLYF